ncbi:nitrate- and nitrite sensing domain-containing protein [Streptosporangium sp. NBC_01756]|uniref:nitrate- and nitrite sensing domain-containing protein n=1 Tax=Streptosporangium sp. NBC_01756 TaxID=2975950 RepID=UPI002DD93893|nr:nitrate- and nitrite sensing domain-containing protein [Streptosporangium sp. NBC_01756]WSC84170.1 nitrate- and nitrite sensing domain-containing protein [Streptosporangium sp. NBC_01756]
MRSRLTALILVPTVVGVLLGGTRVVASVDNVTGYQRTASAAEYSGDLRNLAQALGLERDRTAWASFQPSNKGLKSSAEEQRKTVDALVGRVRLDLEALDESYGDRAVNAAKDVTYQLAGLKELRQLSGTTQAERYAYMISPLLQLHEELTLVSEDTEIVGNMRALSALAYAKEEVSKERARLLAGYYAPSLINAQEIEKFIASRSRLEEYKADFGVEAGPESSQLLVKAMIDEKMHRAELTKSRAIVLASDPGNTGRLLSDFNQVKQWFSDNAAVLDAMRKVETKVAADVITRARMLEETEQRNAIIVSGIILLSLLLILVLTILIARSMVLPLRRLRAEALDVAGFTLPEAVRRLRVSGNSQAPDIAPISVDTKDEIGEVAKAFDEVHRQAVRLATEESELRSNISAMFVNLSRRTQTLVERQISLIDGLEKGEEDGGRLADLFKLDHLATRMRRNSENLLVLAGHEPTRRRSQPAKLVDVVRASLSEVEDYERVQIKVHRTISVAGSTANDIVHLVAELVENAIQFSPRASQVVVSSSMIEGGGALLAVSDAGIGMTTDELIETNRRLADPPVVDVSVSRRMGLFVVGRLALRHGIRVQLRPQEAGGLIAMVLFPPELVVEAVQPPITPSWGTESQAQQASGQASPFGQSSFGQTSSGQASPFGQSSFGQTSSGQASPFGQSSFGHTSSGQDSPFGQSSFGQSSFGHTSSGHASFGQSSFGQGSFGQVPEPESAPFGSTSFPGLGRQQGEPAASVTGGHPLPKRQVPGANGARSIPNSGSPPWEQASEEDPATASMPAVRVSPLESEQEEYLPIFAATESAWFRRSADPDGREAGEYARHAASPQPGLPDPVIEAPTPVNGMPVQEWVPAREPDGWQTAADAGWQAAQAASDPALGGLTSSGLPKRTPKANLVPGAVSAAPSSPMPSLSPERARNRLSSFQQGVRRGRAELNENPARNLAADEEGS